MSRRIEPQDLVGWGSSFLDDFERGIGRAETRDTGNVDLGAFIERLTSRGCTFRLDRGGELFIARNIDLCSQDEHEIVSSRRSELERIVASMASRTGVIDGRRKVAA